MESISRHPAAALRRAGLRVTAPRLAVLAALADAEPHPSADAVVVAVRARLGDTSAQTVYNVLRTLTEAGLVRRIEPAGPVRHIVAALVGRALTLAQRACRTAAPRLATTLARLRPRRSGHP